MILCLISFLPPLGRTRDNSPDVANEGQFMNDSRSQIRCLLDVNYNSRETHHECEVFGEEQSRVGLVASRDFHMMNEGIRR